jgi:hypothetical protein
MTPPATLTQLGTIIAENSQGNDEIRSTCEAMAIPPETVSEAISLIVEESRRKTPDHNLIDTIGFMVGKALEALRYGVERFDATAITEVETVRAQIKDLAHKGKLDPDILLLILCQFVVAKLDPGDELKAMMANFVDHQLPSALPDKTEIDRTLADLSKKCHGDIFLLQAQLAEQASAFPESHRARIVAALLGAPDPTLWEMTLGWLLDSGATTRRDTAILLREAAAAGQISGTMLRRLMAIRNWVPADDRAAVDAVIRICHENGVECAPVGATELRDVVASAIDGSGAQSVFVVVKDGHKEAAVSLQLKQGIGVRNAWVNGGLSKAQVDLFLSQVEVQAYCYDSGPEHLRLTLGHALAMAQKSGVPPPFGLIDVLEKAGLSTIPPKAVPVDDLVARLMAEIPAECLTPPMVAQALADSGDWKAEFPFLASWFDIDEDVDTLLRDEAASAQRRAELLLDQHFSTRRLRWAELLAWTALTLRQDKASKDVWVSVTLVARELLGQRPLTDIPVMTTIAEKTVEVWESRFL